MSLAFEPDATIQYTTTADLRPAPDLARGKDGDSLGGPDSAVLRAFARDALAGIDPAADPEAAAAALERTFHADPFRYELDLAPRGPNALEGILTTRHAATARRARAPWPSRCARSDPVTLRDGVSRRRDRRDRALRARARRERARVGRGVVRPGEGWLTFDPTPSVGQPSSSACRSRRA